MPGSYSARVVGPAKGKVGVAENRGRLKQYVVGREPSSLPIAVAQPPGALEVRAVLSAFQMVVAVVLVERLRAHEPEVTAAEEASVAIGDDELWFDLDVADPVEDSKEGLPGRLGSWVRPGQGGPEAERASSPGAGEGQYDVPVAVAASEGRVEQHRQVEKVQMPCTREQRLRGRRHSQTVHDVRGGQRPVAGHHQPRSLRSTATRDRREGREIVGQRRQPPASDPGGCEMGQLGGRRQDCLPRPLLGESGIEGVDTSMRSASHPDPGSAGALPSGGQLDLGLVTPHLVSVTSPLPQFMPEVCAGGRAWAWARPVDIDWRVGRQERSSAGR